MLDRARRCSFFLCRRSARHYWKRQRSFQRYAGSFVVFWTQAQVSADLERRAVTWLEGRHLLGVWGEQRARHSIDGMHTLYANDSDARAVVLATQAGVVAVVDLTPLDDLNPLRRALNARLDALAADAEQKAKKALLSNSSNEKPGKAADSAPPLPPPQLLPELARFDVALPPHATSRSSASPTSRTSAR